MAVPSLINEGSIISFAGIDVEWAVARTVLGSHGSRGFKGEIYSMNLAHQVLSVPRC